MEAPSLTASECSNQKVVFRTFACIRYARISSKFMRLVASNSPHIPCHVVAVVTCTTAPYP